MIYLDYQATTPLAPEVAAAMSPWIEEKFANPHSPYSEGREAAAAIEVARGKVDSAIGLDDGQCLFTGSATEAINWALKGTMERTSRSKIVTIATEHAAVLDSVDWLGRRYDVIILPIDHNGLVDLEALAAAVDEETALVATMLVNNEIGVIQPIAEIAAIAHRAGALMLCDAVQGLGRVAIPEGPDLVAISGHKIHGPKAIGALWVKNGCMPAPFIHGGGQEAAVRSGTLSPALCVGMGAAAELAANRFNQDHAHVERLWHVAIQALDPSWVINGSTENRYRGNLNIRREHLDTACLLEECRDIAMSLGSACASGSGRPSHVLRALGLSDKEARSSLRLGFGRYTSEAELRQAIDRINQAADSQFA